MRTVAEIDHFTQWLGAAANGAPIYHCNGQLSRCDVGCRPASPYRHCVKSLSASYRGEFVKLATQRVSGDDRTAILDRFLTVARQAGVTHISEACRAGRLRPRLS